LLTGVTFACSGGPDDPRGAAAGCGGAGCCAESHAALTAARQTRVIVRFMWKSPGTVLIEIAAFSLRYNRASPE
jgi:hypothetical protein